MPSGLEQYQMMRTVRDALYSSIVRAEDRETGQRVALQRIVLAGVVPIEQVTSRLVAQIEVVGKFALPGVCQPLCSGAHPAGGVFIVWEWAEGRPTHLPANSARDVSLWPQKVAAILKDAHHRGLVHLPLRRNQILVSRVANSTIRSQLLTERVLIQAGQHAAERAPFCRGNARP